MEGGDFGFCGVAYQAPMVLQAADQAINYYVEVAEVDGAKMPVALLGTPGLATLVTSIPAAVRGSWVLPGGSQALVVIGATAYLCTVAQAPTATSRAVLQLTPVGTLLTNSGTVCIRDNGARFGGAGGYAVVVDGTYGYYYTLSGQPYTVTFTGGLTLGSPTITVNSIPNGLVIGPSVTLSDTDGFIGVSTVLYSGSMTTGSQTVIQPASPIPGGSMTAGIITIPHSTVVYTGYSNATTAPFRGGGSYTPIVQFPGNNTLAFLADLNLGGSILTIGGFSSDPGQS